MSHPVPPADTGMDSITDRLHTLAPIADLNPDDSNFKAYYNHLNSIFRDPSLRNIALVGNRGSGKSSILHSYDRSRPNKTGDFLFISLIDFEHREQTADKASPPAPGKSDRKSSDSNAAEPDKKDAAAGKTEARQAQRLEYSLLCQILARCTRQDLAGSTLSGIPEPPTTYADLPNCLTFLFLTVFPLFFQEPLGNMLRTMGIPDEGVTVLHGLLLCVLAFSAALSLHWLARLLLPRLQVQKLSLKGTHAQADLALEGGKHCLDQFKFELIYILNRISDKIGCTVVFEDMERLESGVCVEIMTKLRELNTLVNTHRQTLDPSLTQKPIRFLYAMSDEVFDCDTRTKFFDYVMPVVPVLNATNAEEMLKNLLHNTETKVDRKNIQALIPIIAPCLTDYRTLRSVIGEYQMLQHIYAASTDDLKEYMILDADNSKLLALAVYKVLFPKEYYYVFIGSAAFVLPSEKQYSPMHCEMAKALFDNGYLDSATLRMIGYSESQIKDQWWRILMSGDYGAKSSLLSRFLFTDSPDKKAFTDVIHTVVEMGNIFDSEESVDIARWIGKFYFREPHVILEQLVACIPSDYTPQAFVNHLACLSNFHNPDLARAAVVVGPDRIADALIQYLKYLDLEISYSDDPIHAEEWATGPHTLILFHLLGASRNHIPAEVLGRKLGDLTLEQLRDQYLDNFCRPKDDRFLVLEESALVCGHAGKSFRYASSEYVSSFDADCLIALRDLYGSSPEDSKKQT